MFSSSKLDEFEKKDGYVSAKRIRDKNTTSVIDANVDESMVDVILEL